MDLLLEPQELLDLGSVRCGVNVACRSGCLWLTQEGDDLDHLLRAGEQLRVVRRGRVLLLPLVQSQIQLLPDPSRSARTSWRWPWRQKNGLPFAGEPVCLNR